MAQASTSVTSTLPRVGLCAVTLPPNGPSIQTFEMPDNGLLVAYDRGTWTREQIDGWVRIYFGDYELVQPAEGGA